MRKKQISIRMPTDLRISKQTQLTEKERWKSLLFSDRKLILIITALLVCVIAVFLPSLRNGFFDGFADDSIYVTLNPHVNSGLTLENILWAFTSVRTNWHPMTWLSHMLDCQIFGLKPWGHHLTNVLLHGFNAVLLFVFLRRITGATWRSLAVAVLFGVHPLRVESVAWVAERKDVLSTFFWMLALLMYVRSVEQSKDKSPKSKLFYVVSLVCFACGLMSKSMVVTLPFVLLLLDYWPLKRNEESSLSNLILEKVPFFVLTAATSAVTYLTQKNWGFLETASALSFGARFENALVSYGRYVGKMFWPVDLCSYYPQPGHWPASAIIIAVVFLVGTSILAFGMRRSCPWLGIGWLWYLGTLVPVIGLVGVGDASMADRYSYIPMIGILISLVWGLGQLTNRWRYQAIAWPAISVAVVVFCAQITQRQIGYFKDSLTAWRHNLEVTGDVEVAQFIFAMSLRQLGHTDEAIKELRAVLKHSPKRAEVHYSLATLLEKRGRMDEAIGCYREAVKLSPVFSNARYNLGLNLIHKGLTNDAIVQFEEIIKLKRDALAYSALGTTFASSGHIEEAINYFKEALRDNADTPAERGRPDDMVGYFRSVESDSGVLNGQARAEVHLSLGTLLNQQGHIDEAMTHYHEAIKLSPNLSEARFNLAMNLLNQGLSDEAATQFAEMIKVNRDPRAYNALGTIRYSSGNIDEAINYFKEGLKENPHSAEIHSNLGIALNDKGLKDESILHFQEALRLDPNATVAREYLNGFK